MAVTIKWNGPRVMRQVEAEAVRRLAMATAHVVVKVKENISTSSQRGANPSDPGELPHADLGTLRNSIRGEVSARRLRGRVGTNLFYARFLELSTKNMAARPFLRRTLNEQKQRVRRILSRGR